MPRILSVVVIGRNEGDRLMRCLDSIRSIRGLDEGTETIYVDSASTDGSPERAAATGATVVVVTSRVPTAALGRNAGWKVAAGEFVLFLDGDTVLHADFPLLALQAMSNDSTLAAVWGHRRELYPKRSIYNRVLDLDWVFRPGFTDYCGGDVLMRRQALEDVQGYDASLIAGEEPELCRRLRAKGYRILHIDQPMTGHDLAMTRFRQYWRRAIRTGHAYAEVSKRFRDSPDPLWQGVRVANLLRGGFWTLTAASAAILSIAWWTWVPAALWLGFLFLLAMRSAWKVRWKSSDVLSLFLYGFHSHLQQVPVFVGQLQFDFNARRGRKRDLIEYR